MGHPAMKLRGFTLLELLITVAIVGILAAIALPSYFDQIRKSHRADAKSAALTVAVQMQRYFTERNTFVGATLGTGGVYPSTTSENGYYALSLTNLTANTFTLNATPAGPQVGDSCGTYTYTELGAKDVVSATKPAAECWK